jgi:hypothetical protein
MYTVGHVWLDGEVMLERRCPECEYQESVVVSALGASARHHKDSQSAA